MERLTISAILTLIDQLSVEERQDISATLLNGYSTWLIGPYKSDIIGFTLARSSAEATEHLLNNQAMMQRCRYNGLNNHVFEYKCLESDFTPIETLASTRIKLLFLLLSADDLDELRYRLLGNIYIIRDCKYYEFEQAVIAYSKYNAKEIIAQSKWFRENPGFVLTHYIEEYSYDSDNSCCRICGGLEPEIESQCHQLEDLTFEQWIKLVEEFCECIISVERV